MYGKDDIRGIEDLLQVRHTLSQAPLKGCYQYETIHSDAFMQFLNFETERY